MHMKRCPAGHYYDDARHDACPHCLRRNRAFDGQIPERFLRLGLTEPLGEGASARVYRITGEETCALKVLSCGADPEAHLLALHEITVMRHLAGNPFAVQLRDACTQDEDGSKTVYLLEECRTPLSDYLEKHALTAAEAIVLTLNACEGMIACREAGVYHLDIQPRNLFVDDALRVWLGDFGSALFADELAEHRGPRGTLGYMAPEVYRGGQCGERSEICSLGLLLHRLLDGGLPFMHSAGQENAGVPAYARRNDNSTAVYMRLAGTPIPDLDLEDGELAARASALIREACTYEPADRLPSLEVFRDRLRALLAYAAESDAAQKPLNGAEWPGMPDTEMHSVGWSSFSADPTAYSVPARAASAYALSGQPDAWDDGTPDGDAFQDTEKPAASPAPAEPPRAEQVQFSAVAPRSLRRDEYAMIDLLMYTAAWRHAVDELIRESETPVRETRSGIMKVREDAEVRVTLTSPDFPIEDGTETQIWQGGYLSFRFAVRLPEDFAGRQALFVARVDIDGVIMTRLRFVAQCEAAGQQRLALQRFDVSSAFVSYASDDRERVVSIIQGMQKVRPDLDIFFDVESLHSGDDWKTALYREIDARDVLFLCWSRPASRSRWVDAEWRYALRQKGIDSIEPVPIESPDLCPPPEELSGKHFNDRLLYVIRAKREE